MSEYGRPFGVLERPGRQTPVLVDPFELIRHLLAILLPLYHMRVSAGCRSRECFNMSNNPDALQLLTNPVVGRLPVIPSKYCGTVPEDPTFFCFFVRYNLSISIVALCWCQAHSGRVHINPPQIFTGYVEYEGSVTVQRGSLFTVS